MLLFILCKLDFFVASHHIITGTNYFCLCHLTFVSGCMYEELSVADSSFYTCRFVNMVACFRYASIDVHSVYLPPSKLDFNFDNQYWIQRELNEVESSPPLNFFMFPF